MIFFVSFLVVVGMAVLGIWFYQATSGGTGADTLDLQGYFTQALLGFGILIMALVWRAIRKARAQHLEKFQRKELSRDEISKARSKLVNRNKT